MGQNSTITTAASTATEEAAATTQEPKRTPCRHHSDPGPQPCATCKSERRSKLKYRWKIILGLFLPFTLSALDYTIIASALPWISSDFGEVHQLNWIVSAFNLTAAAFIPFWGQMADIFGRHVAIQACIFMVTIGSAICTGAPTDAFPLLLFGRALQGIGCAGMNVVIRAIVADKVSLREDAKNWSIFSIVGGCSYAVGPVIGGYLTETHWRWCFGINLPVALVGMAVVFIVLRKELLGPQPIPQLDETAETGRRTTFVHRLKTIDVGGQVLSIFGFGLLILGFTWAGASYGWASAAVLVPLITGVLLIAAFVWWEYEMTPGNRLARKFPWQQAMIPWEVISNRDIGLLFYASFATGMAMFSVLYFCTLYFTMVKHLDAGDAGRQLLLFVPGLGVGVWMAIFFCNSYPRQTWHPIFLGSVIELIGIGVLAWALWREHDPTVYAMMALTGVGIGMRFMPVPLHGMAYFPKRIAAVISLSEISEPLGGTIGLTVMTTVFNNVAGIGEGIVWAYIAILPFMVLCVIASGLLGNVYISKDTDDEEDEQANTIYHGVYLWALLRGKGGSAAEDSDRVTTTRRAAWRDERQVLPQHGFHATE
ncbi:hypothetical protein ACRALDRAFT_1026476 [Sodiomyces alcalophilus JCM 7366]|uniref:uncharacterized protein n=1 Tax=Sodiomyces alcalophilus JCM 7366 TaxID=591952 RepID=UPI0039B4E473